MSTGGKMANQAATPGDGDSSGGNMSGGSKQKAAILFQPSDFMGKSGQSDNQSTNRPKGTT